MFTEATTYPIAIDIQGNNLYAVQLKGKGQGLTIKGLAHKKLKQKVTKDREDWDDLIAELRDITKNKAFGGKRAVFHLPAQFTHVFPVSVHVKDGDTVEEALLAESGKHLSFPIEEAVIDYPSIVQTVSGNTATYRSIIVGAQLSNLQQMMAEFKKAGLSVEAVDVDISSLIRVHRYFHDLGKDFVSLCYIGHGQSVLSVVNQERILVYRHIPWGISTLIARLQEQLGLARSEVITILKEHGVSKKGPVEKDAAAKSDDAGLVESVGAALVEILAPYLEEFVYAFHNVTGYAISEAPDVKIKKAYLYGQADIIKGFDAYLKNALNTSVELINPLEQVPYRKGLRAGDLSEAGSFSLAFGLAMRKIPWL